jgi:hypothetical protein
MGVVFCQLGVGDWEIGELGDWEIGKSVSWEIGNGGGIGEGWDRCGVEGWNR